MCQVFFIFVNCFVIKNSETPLATP